MLNLRLSGEVDENRTEPCEDHDKHQPKPGRGAPISANGGTLIPFAPGHNGHNSSTVRRALRAIGRHHTPEAMRALIKLARTTDDGRVAVTAWDRVLTWTWGDPRNLPVDDERSGALDLSRLRQSELDMLLKALRAGRLVIAPDVETSSGETSDAEPPIIDGDKPADTNDLA